MIISGTAQTNNESSYLFTCTLLKLLQNFKPRPAKDEEPQLQPQLYDGHVLPCPLYKELLWNKQKLLTLYLTRTLNKLFTQHVSLDNFQVSSHSFLSQPNRARREDLPQENFSLAAIPQYTVIHLLILNTTVMNMSPIYIAAKLKLTYSWI